MIEFAEFFENNWPISERDQKKEKSELIEAIKSAQNYWTDCDWETGIDNTDEEEEYKERVVNSANEAISQGNLAIVHINAGNIESARECIDLADSEENQWGDNPTWGPVLDKIKKLQER